MPEKHFKRGDTVRFRFGSRQVNGVIEEDRGPIGINGRHLYLIAFNVEPDYPSQIELPANQLQHVERTAVTARAS